MLFSIIISTHNRSSLLGSTINSILAQTFRDFEIIVSDDGSTDNTRQIVESFMSDKITYLNAGVKRGLSAVRNSALLRSKGEYVIVIDDDITLSVDFLNVLSGIVADTNIDAFCPKLVDFTTGKPFVSILDDNERVLGFFDFNYFRGGAHVISKRALKRVGYYDERFGVGAKYYSAEETDYFFRLKQSGCKVIYCPNLTAYHQNPKELSGEKVFKYSYGIAAMLVKQIIEFHKGTGFYIVILLWRIFISLIRTVQYNLFPATIEEKNRIYKYRYFFTGTLYGIKGYIFKR